MIRLTDHLERYALRILMQHSSTFNRLQLDSAMYQLTVCLHRSRILYGSPADGSLGVRPSATRCEALGWQGAEKPLAIKLNEPSMRASAPTFCSSQRYCPMVTYIHSSRNFAGRWTDRGHHEQTRSTAQRPRRTRPRPHGHLEAQRCRVVFLETSSQARG